MNRFLSFAAAALSLLLSSRVRAQGDTTTISGRVATQSGEVLVGAQIHVTNLEVGTKVLALTNDHGIYVVRNLRPGDYRMTVDKEGFRQIVLTGLTLNLQDSIGRNFTMQIGSVIQSITVTASGQELNISPAVGTIVNQQFVENLPLNGRSFQSLIGLTPALSSRPKAIPAASSV